MYDRMLGVVTKTLWEFLEAFPTSEQWKHNLFFHTRRRLAGELMPGVAGTRGGPGQVAWEQETERRFERYATKEWVWECMRRWLQDALVSDPLPYQVADPNPAIANAATAM
jgi:hypothetical protein